MVQKYSLLVTHPINGALRGHFRGAAQRINEVKRMMASEREVYRHHFREPKR